MKITGEELFKIWVAWPVRDDVLDVPFVIESETALGEERYWVVRRMQTCSHDDDCYEVKLYNYKFRPVTRLVNRKQMFNILEDGRFEALDWS